MLADRHKLGARIMTQRDKMRELVRLYRKDTDKIFEEYAAAGARGEVQRIRNIRAMDAEKYAMWLLRDAHRRAWL